MTKWGHGEWTAATTPIKQISLHKPWILLLNAQKKKGGHFQCVYKKMASSSDQTQGYQCEFIDSVPENFYCKKCTLVARRISITTCCGESFCYSCTADTQEQGNEYHYWLPMPHKRGDNYWHTCNKMAASVKAINVSL